MSDPPRFLSANRESWGGRLLDRRDDDPPDRRARRPSRRSASASEQPW